MWLDYPKIIISTNNKVSCGQKTLHCSSRNYLLYLQKTWYFTRHFFKGTGLQQCFCQGEGHTKENSNTARWQNWEDGEDEGNNKTNLAHYIVAPPHYKHRITIGGTVIILFEEEKEQWMMGRAAEIIKSALIIPVFTKPHGKGRIKCHCREVLFELYVSLCLWISLLVCILPRKSFYRISKECPDAHLLLKPKIINQIYIYFCWTELFGPEPEMVMQVPCISSSV